MEGYECPGESILGFPPRLHQLPSEIGAFTATTQELPHMNARRTNFRTLDRNLLKVFDVVMAERNVTRAATRLAMTQHAVSNALRRLRESTNEELFVPTAIGVNPTAHAHALWPTVRASLDNLQDAFEPQGFDPQVDERTFTLAMADATAAVFAPVLADAMQREQSEGNLRFAPLRTRD